MANLVYRITKGRNLTPTEGDQNMAAINAELIVAPKYISQCNVPIPRASNNSTDATEFTIKSVPLPGGIMGLNSKISIIGRWSFTGSTNTKIMSVYFGNVSISGIPINTLANVGGKFLIEIENMGSIGSQEIFNGSSYAVTNSAPVATNIDTSIDQLIDIRCKWSANVASESIILKSYAIIHNPGIA